ncbi:non-POU domain-containing octamer-binding protein-like isoform X1 [Limulus polyphemus]|uniref:Non-POU domain-containing octamer-binding protein-like isoform X1 n=1 Tax=Limulus polyphemus TaxID=6850 RepID=A0ABM1BHT4_LIMPO|nr:non-POU domain-containing octamer-binding protein-like isoform X1 [Limulus polyphemus]
MDGDQNNKVKVEAQQQHLEIHENRPNKRQRNEGPSNPQQRGGRADNRDRDRGGRPSNQRGGNMRKERDFVKERLANVSGPTTNLQTKEGEPKKFTGRCRLFVGNLPPNTTEEDFKKMFEPFGETAEVFLNNQKAFGFIKLDTRQNAEAAKAALDLTVKDGKSLRVRFATHGAALKVKNLTPWVSNELLEAAFSIFGEVERAVVIVDDRGRPVGEGIVEYSRKLAAQAALKRCTDGCFLLTSSPRPVLVEPLEQRDEEDGLQEKTFVKNSKQYQKERDIGPRLAEPGSFEYEYAMRWKKLYDLEKQKRENLEKEILEARQQLEDQMDYAFYEHETNMLREKLRHMEEQSNIIQREREMRREEERRREEQRRQEEMMIRQQQEELLRRRTAEEMRRIREDNLMLQYFHNQDSTMKQEVAIRQMHGGMSVAGQGLKNEMNDSISGGNMGGYDISPSGAAGSGGPGGMMQGPGAMGMAGRQSRFDQPPPSHHIGGDMNIGNPMNHGSGPHHMGGGEMGGMRGGVGGGPREMQGGPREHMMDQRGPRDDYGMEPKRRRY